MNIRNKSLGQTWLWQYWDAVQRGEIIAGLELRAELDRLLADLDDDRYFYDTREADRRIDFMQNCIRLTKSPFYGKPMRLMLWQKALIETIFGFKMAADGCDRFQRVVLLIARKNTKSETCSALLLTEALIGQPGADLVCSSNDDPQADILFGAVDTMRQMIDPESRDTWRNRKGIRIQPTGSMIFKLSDRTRNKEGRNIDFAVVDECHEMKDNVIVKSIEQSQSLKENPKLILITTEGFVNDGFLDEELRHCRAILAGEDDDLDAERTLPWLYTQDSEHEVWHDRSSWVKSNPSLGVVKKWDYLDTQISRARKSKPDRMFVLAKDFNVKQSNAQAWLMEEDYRYPAIFDIEEFRGALALGAVDLSETTDLTNAKLLMMRPGDRTKYIYSHYFIPEGKLARSDDREAGADYREWARAGYVTICEGNDIDLDVVADWFLQMYQEYDIRVMNVGYDQKFAKQWLKRMGSLGFDTEMVLQNKYVMSAPLRLVEADFQSRLINYGGNPVDAWCLGNTAIEVDGAGLAMCVKIRGQHARRIDGAVTLVILYEMYKRYRTEFLQGIGE